MPQPKLKSEKGAFSLKTFQFEFAKRTRRNEFSQLRVRRFTQAARFAQRAGQLFQAEDQIYFASHQAFLAHRCDAADRNWSEMHYEAEVRPALLLEFCERGDHRHDFFPSRPGLGPIGEKTIAQVFVNNAVVVLDDLLASENPRSEKNVQVLALHPAAERRETANVRDEKPARNILDFPQRSLGYHRFVFV